MPAPKLNWMQVSEIRSSHATNAELMQEYGVDRTTVQAIRNGRTWAGPNKRMLPPFFTPRGLSRESAASYIGVSPSLFDKLVADGRMPRPKLINRRNVWDCLMLDNSFEDLPDKDSANRHCPTCCPT